MNGYSIYLLAAAAAGTDSHGDGHDSGGQFPPLDASTYPSQLFWLTVTFGVLLFLLWRIFLPRLNTILEDRSEKIADDIDTAARMQRDAENEKKTYEKELADARAKAHNVAESTRASVNADLEAEYEVAEKEAQENLDLADAKIRAMRTEALKNVDDIAARATTEMLNSLYGGKISMSAAKKAVKAVD